MGSSRRRRLWLGAVGVYAVLLAVSHGLASSGDRPPDADEQLLTLPPVGDAPAVRMAWQQWGRATSGTDPVVLLHGSPGSHRDFRRLAPRLSEGRLLLAPDLPGFGASTRRVADYSIRAHAAYVLRWLDELGVGRVHLVGFSMGGGVALELYHLAPQRVASITLLAGIGVQEMELLGSYELNHALHGLQLAALWLLYNGVPHMGLLDDFPLDLEYARNFYDTDQRPLRTILQQVELPMLIVHGRDDFLVPPEAAVEHHRLVPQSDLVMLDTDHFFVFRGREDVAERLAAFWGEVEAGSAVARRDARPERVAQSRRAFDPRNTPRWQGPALLTITALLAVATLVSEDLTCIGAGLLVAEGRLTLTPAVLGCLVGIFFGDLMLFAAGRWLGRPVVRRAPLKWWLTEAKIVESSAWFERRGGVALVMTRFLPGTRLATYFAAGVLRTSFWRFAAYMLFAVAIWTPLIVLFAARAGAAALDLLGGLRSRVVLLLLVPLLLLVLIRRVILPLLTWTGRRRLLGTLRRWTRWEFWPPWLFYPPIVLYVLGLGLRHRGLTVFTAANPALPAGGFLGESKAEILAGLGPPGGHLPAWQVLEPGELADRVAVVSRFVAQSGKGWPVVLKPDAGQRGAGVAVVRSIEAAEVHLSEHPERFLVQEHVGGAEFGVFYYRFPGEAAGRLFSITEKRVPVVVGDGERTIEQLVLADRRAVALAGVYLRELGPERFRVPAREEEVGLTEIGAHSRGMIFLDGSHHRTPALAAALDRVVAPLGGFYFGRFDVRVPSAEDLEAGRGIVVLELNGVTAESTDIYDPRNGLFHAWGKIMRQWSLAFRIGAACRRRGHAAVSLGELAATIVHHRRLLPW